MLKRPSYITKENLRIFIESAIREDVGDGDHSTLASVPKDSIQKAQLIIKDDCVLAGVDLAQEIFHYYDSSFKISVLKNDGEEAKKGDIGFIVEGPAQSILTMERLVLNCMQRMSGIATSAREAASLVAGTNTKILDTRKTTPNFRMCEKWAVYIGGATNHRYGLFDMIMLKDNHNDYAGGITKAVNATVQYLQQNKKSLKIEVETRNLEEVKEALETKVVDIIMLDNMSLFEMKEAIALIGDQAKTEASGGITKDSIKEISSIGVNFISSGAIIYNAPHIDLSLKAI